jgi:hypothetical protein
MDSPRSGAQNGVSEYNNGTSTGVLGLRFYRTMWHHCRIWTRLSDMHQTMVSECQSQKSNWVTGAILKTQITFYMWITTHAFSMCEDHVIVNVFFVICVPFL